MRYESIKEKAPSFLAATGLRREEFEKLLPFFIVAYGEAYPLERRVDGGERRRRAGAGAKSKLGSMEDKLLFILNYHKTNPLQEQHGLLFGMSQGRVNIWVHKLFPVLQQALRLAGVSPCRDGSILNDHIASLGNNINGLELAIDGTERPRQRPKDSEKQRDCYSGKKKQHTHKNTIIGDKEKSEIVYLGPTTEGRVHDKKMADAEEIALPEHCVFYKDTGYQGFEPEGVQKKQPKKSLVASL